jgi:carbon-monoxide dehydrogenase large subunit
VGVLSQGQGHETTLAQIAAAVSGVPIERISVRQGDTDVAPYGTGTVASRSIVMAGGAIYHACLKLTERLRAIAASQLGCEPVEITLRGGVAVAPSGSLDYTVLADVAWQKIHKLPPGLDAGLEFLHLYRPEIETGTFASGMHAARVAVDMETGAVRILDYVVVEDCGQQINPVIVEGQVHGGVAQGIGQALCEAFRFDDAGQPLAGTLMDYALPNANDVPSIGIEHQHTYSSFGVFGMKGTGEGGAIAPPAAIANAVCDALGELNIGVSEVPLSSNVVWRAIGAAQRGAAGAPVRTYI